MREITVDSYKGYPSQTITLKECGSDICDSMYDSGTIIMATGIIAFVAFIAAVVLLCVAHRKGLPNYRYGALALLYITSALMILGSVLYAEKAAAGYSFILMIIAGFFYFCGSFRKHSGRRGAAATRPSAFRSYLLHRCSQEPAFAVVAVVSGVGLVLGGGWKISVSKGASNPPQEVSDAH